MDPLYEPHKPGYERDKMMGSRHPRRSRWLLLAAGISLAALLVWLVPQNRNDREQWEGGGVEVGSANQGSAHSDIGGPEEKETGAVATAGDHDATGGESASVLREIETITGANDAMSLVGRRVDLHVDVQARANDYAFWVGPSGNRVLVVWARDTRDGVERQAGTPSDSGVQHVRDGQRAAISGVVRPIPRAEHRYSWNLTEDDRRELADRKVYIHADRVSPESE